MKILLSEAEAWEKALFEQQLADSEIISWPAPLSPDHLPPQRQAEALAVFVNSQLNRQVLDAFPNLKFIATRSTGFDHIDLKYCQEKGIAVANVPTYGERTVAEYAFALLLELTRKVGLAYEQVQKYGFAIQDNLRGRDLAGKVLVVVGTGRIGSNVAVIGRAFNMSVLCVDQNQNEALHERGCTYCSLDEALSNADVISLHLPALPTTHHLINQERIAKLKPGVVIINTARGSVIDTQALVWGLKQGIVGGAALDVLEEEGALGHREELALLSGDHLNSAQLQTVLQDEYLIHHPGVIITPHNAFNTQEAIERIAKTSIQNLKAFEAGQAVNLVS